jgi:predicted Zn-dependent protease
VLVSLFLSAAPAAGQARHPLGAKTLECATGYRKAVDDYRARRTEEAVAALAALDHEQLRIVVGSLAVVHSGTRTNPLPTDGLFAWTRQTLLAAAMLLVELSIAEVRAKRIDDFEFHTTLAATVFAIVDDPETNGSTPGTTGRRSALAIGLLLLNGGSSLASAFLKNAVKRFPDDAPLQVALGMIDQFQATGVMEPGTREPDIRDFARARDRRDAQLHNAAARFERAIALDPQLVEARIRLAHVHILRHEDVPAAALLEETLVHEPAVHWAYLARLMLGGIRERAGRREEAIHVFADAVRACPDGQSGYVAMSHAMFADGDRVAAAQVLDRLFGRALTPESDDPWWDYQSGDWKQADEITRALRAEAQR